MPKFGKRSLDNLATVHPTLRKVMELAVSRTAQDFTVICGHRGKADQDAAQRAGNSKVKFPNSAHNQQPSAAVDVIPYPFKGWNDKDIHKELKEIARVVLSCAAELGVTVRWGGNWNTKDVDAKGTGFVDSVHFELFPWQNYRT